MNTLTRGGNPANTGQFSPAPRAASDSALAAPATVELSDNSGQRFTLDTGVFGWEAEQVFSRGHCAAFAAALAPQFPDATIRVATDREQTVLIHAWLADGDMMVDATEFYTFEEDFLEPLVEHWGHVEVLELTVEELRGWYDAKGATTEQGWDEAEAMAPAYLDRHYS